MTAKTLPTTAGTNPLRRQALTPEQYARLHHAVRAKASRTLVDLNAQLEAELRSQLDDAVRANAELAAEVEDLEAQLAPMESRRNSLKSRKTKLKQAIEKAEEVNAKLREDLSDARAVRDKRDECLTDIAQLQRELHVARREEDRIKKILGNTRTRTSNLLKVIEDGEDEGAKRRLAMDNELVERRRQKRQAAERLPVAVTPLAG